MKQSRFLHILLVVVLIPLLLIQFPGTAQKVSARGDPTWSDNVRVNDDAGLATAQVAPSVAAYGNGNVYLAWLDLRNYPSRDIYFAKSTDGGSTWGTNVRVNDNTSPVDANWPSLVVDGSGNLYLAWGDTRDGKWKSYFSKSTDGGSTWSTNVRISDQTGDATVPILVVDNNGNLDAVWTEDRTGNYDIYFSRSVDGGVGWSSSVKINNDIGSAYQVHPKLVVDSSGKLYATWKDCRNVTWKSCNQGDMPFYDLYFAASTDSGSTWNANVRINDFPGSVWQNGPSGLSVDSSGNIYVIWDDTRNDVDAFSRIYFAKSGDGGVSWSANIPVSTNPVRTAEVYNYGLVMDNGGNLYAVWGDNRAGGANYDVYFALSIDGGNSWSTNSKVNDDTTSEPQYQTTLAIDGNGNIYAAWADDRGGNFDIYSSSLKHMTLNTPPVITEGDSVSVTMSKNGIPTAFNLTLHATDADTDSLTWSIASPASHGTASASGIGDSKAIGYIPYTDYVGSDSFMVQVDDGNGGTDTITVNVAVSFYLHVRAYIDGVSHLIVKGDTVTWHHMEFDAPGRWDGHNDPTYINETEWYPSWPDLPTASNINCNCDSSTLSGIFPALPAEEQIVTVNLNQGYMVSIVQQPKASNEYTLIIEFNDAAPGGASWYDIVVYENGITNTPPIITEGDSISVTMSQDGSPTAFGLTLHVTDADADTFSWSISSPASHGTATASGTGDSKAIGYIPYTDYVGSDPFVVQVDDGNGGTDTITINVTINATPSAGIRYVTTTGSGDCSSWAGACALQTALTTAISGDEIWAAAGRYTPTTGTDHYATFLLKSGVALYGGFAGTESSCDQRDPAANVTILSGDLNGDDVGFNNRAENVYHVVTVGSGTTGAILDGFTVTGGSGGNYRNGDDGAGAGMIILGSSPTLTNDIFTGNSATYGGGIYVNNGNPTLTNVAFIGNLVGSEGGGIWIRNYSNPILTNVTFSNNTSYQYGGAVDVFWYSYPIFTNVTFSGNSAPMGSVMSSLYSSQPAIRNSILWGNAGTQVYIKYAGNIPIISDSVVQGGCPEGGTCTNIITADPNLGTLGNYGGYTQTVPLLAGSPAIDTGNDTTCPATDQRDVARPQGLHCDIGAFEYIQINTAPVITEGDSVSVVMNMNGVPTPFALTLHATDADDDTLNWNIYSQAHNGIVTADGTGNAKVIDYTPASDYIGSDSFIVLVDDGNGGTDAITIDVTVNPTHTAGIRYVKTIGAGDCSSWVDACALQTALTTAISGDEIWVAAGKYIPITGTDRTATFRLKSGVAIYGGFAGTETQRGERNPSVNVTILSGDLNGDDGAGFANYSDNAYHVVFLTGGGPDTILDGFTVTGGNATLYRDSTHAFGGGMLISGSSPTLMNDTFSGNVANYGGAMYIGNGSYPALSNVTFSGNLAGGGFGGGVFNNNGGNPTFTNVTFSGNSAGSFGGGIYNTNNSNPTLMNVTFTGNSAVGGGAIDGGNPIVRNSLFWGNTAGGSSTSSGAQFYESAPIISDSIVQNGCPGGTCTNIITTDPKLGTLGNYGGLTQTVPLLTGSSAIDTGNDTTCPSADQRGVTRPQGNHCDIGAYEYEGPFNQRPVANAGGPYSIDWGQTLTLDGSGSSDPDNNIAAYEWDLDHDGQYDDATGITPSTSYDQIGDHTISLRVTDTEGLSSADTTTITVTDPTPPAIIPTITGTLGRNGWYTSNVAVNWSVNDPESGIASSDGCDPTALATDTAGTNLTCSATNGAHLSSSITINLKLDKTAPTIVWNGSIHDGDNFDFGFVPPTPGCTATDGMSGVDGPCTVGGYASTVGPHTLTAKANDQAGNPAIASLNYDVSAWTIRGFYQPVDMNGIFNVTKNGSTVPFKFEIFAGSNELTDVAYIKSFTYAMIACDASAVFDELEMTAPGGTSLRYDSASGQFIYNWKTPNTAGKCYRATMITADGSSLAAYFKLK
jgi:hypothetical protein